MLQFTTEKWLLRVSVNWLQGDVAITTNKHAGWNWVAAEVPVMSRMGWVEALCSIWLFSAYKIKLEVVQKCCPGQRYPDHPRHMGVQSLFENLQWWTPYNSRKQDVPLFNSYSWSRNSSWLWVWISLKLSPLGLVLVLKHYREYIHILLNRWAITTISRAI